MKLKKCISILIILGNFLVQGQDKKSKGDAYFFSYAYKEAVLAYEDDLEKGLELEPKQYLNLAESYFELNKFEKATDIYLQLYAKDSVLGNYHLNKLLLGLGKTSNKEKVETFLSKEKPSFQKELFANAEFNSKLLGNGDTNAEATQFKVFNLNSNSPQSDFAPSFYESTLLFSSGRPSEKRKNYEPMGEAYLDIFEGEIDSEGQVSTANQFTRVKRSDYHKATPYYAKELNSIFFVLSNTYENQLEFDENGKNSLAIGVQKIDGAFQFLWRDLSTSFYYPFYDDATGRLYFAANFENGFGGTDIYYVNTNRGRIMSAPINLGPTINSPGNEIAPYVFEGALYFSSDVFYGLGGMDVYKANFKNSEFTIPVNLGSPINSEVDDFGFIIKNYNDGLLGYFSSNREGGEGKDDIYGFIIEEKPGLKTFAISGKAVNLESVNGVPNADIRIFSLQGELLGETKSNENGDYQIEIPWQEGVRLEASKDRYSTFSALFDEGQMQQVQKNNLNLGLAHYNDLVEERENQTVVKLKKFHFTKNKSVVTPDIALELDKVVDFVERFPAVQLRIETHTDSRGGSAYNFRLTQARSDAIKKYLLNKGVPNSNILYSVGYGEDKILNTCKNGVYCIEMMHKQNQRSLIVVLNDNILFN